MVDKGRQEGRNYYLGEGTMGGFFFKGLFTSQCSIGRYKKKEDKFLKGDILLTVICLYKNVNVQIYGKILCIVWMTVFIRLKRMFGNPHLSPDFIYAFIFLFVIFLHYSKKKDLMSFSQSQKSEWDEDRYYSAIFY